MSFKPITPAELSMKPLYDFDKRWALVTAGTPDSFNTMTVSWGGLGTLWNLPVLTVYVRHHRYTFQFTEREPYYTVCFFDPSHKEALGYLGRTSGRDLDKIAQTELTPAFSPQYNAPIFEEATLALVCRKLYFDDIKPENMLDPAIDAKNYPLHDYHRIYIGEIVEALVQE